MRYRDPAQHWRHRDDSGDPDYRSACEEHGDDCHRGNERYWGGYDYGPPVSYYEEMPPSPLDFTQQRDWLIQRRQRAYQVLAKMRGRPDRNTANRMQKVVDRLNEQIAHDNQRTAQGRYAEPVGASYSSAPFGTEYNPNYGNDPTENALGGIVAPLLGLPAY